MIYLDYNATGPVKKAAIDAMQEWWEKYHANPGASYQMGRQARKKIDYYRAQIAEVLNTKDYEIIFTSGGTEANNLAIMGLVSGKAPGQIIMSAIEHASVNNIGLQLQKNGWQVDFVSVNNQGVIELNELNALLSDKTLLVSIMAANNEQGVIQPINQISLLCQQYRVPLHCDAVQLLGKSVFPWEPGNCPDLITFSGHKIGGPAGIGIMVNHFLGQLQPIMLGGSQEFKLRPGTENGAAIAGLAAVIQGKGASIEQYKHIGRLKALMEKRLKAEWPECIIFGEHAKRLPNTLMVAFPGNNGAALLKQLDENGIQVSLGSACNAGHSEPSRVLKKMGFNNKIAISSLRFSLGWQTTEAEINSTVSTIIKLLEASNK